MQRFRSIMSWVWPIVIGLVIALLIKQFWFQPTKVEGTSMDPNLSNGELVVQLKNKPIKRGEVIVFDAHGEDPNAVAGRKYVKRVIALPGDTVSAQNGVLKVNGKTVNQDYISENEQYATNFPSAAEIGNWSSLSELGKKMNWSRNVTDKVPKNQYFVLGDHRSVSNDSRYWGFVDGNKVMGVVKVPFWGSTSQQRNINQEWKHFFD